MGKKKNQNHKVSLLIGWFSVQGSLPKHFPTAIFQNDKALHQQIQTIIIEEKVLSLQDLSSQKKWVQSET